MKLTASSIYSSERASSITGAVALMYPSDYGYGVLSSACARSITLPYYDETNVCHTSNWLYQGSSTGQWLISPDSSESSYVFFVSTTGYINYDDNKNKVVNVFDYSPVMALSADVYVTGSGTESDPYVMN